MSGVSELIARALKEKFAVTVNSEIIQTYKGNREFAEFLTGFLVGKPFWLEAQ